MDGLTCHARRGCLGCQIHALQLLLLQVQRVAIGRQWLLLLLIWLLLHRLLLLLQLHGQLELGARRSAEAG